MARRVTVMVVLLLCLLVAVSARAYECTTCVTGGGTGPAQYPPTCPMRPSDPEVARIVDGLPPGTTIEIPIEIVALSLSSVTPGGSLGGEVVVFEGPIRMPMTGTGELSGFSRNIALPGSGEIHTAPAEGGGLIQTFDTDMFLLQGQISGDPDFDLLRISGGSGGLMPSPGHTTLTQVPSGDWRVDSFFDITYRIDFVGAPGGPLAGMSGSTTGTIRVYQGCPGWVEGDPAKMHYPQPPDGAGWDVFATYPHVAADDWQCTESGPVKDIHFWGSWKGGQVGRILAFHLKIYSDVPQGADVPFSHPGDLLWEGVFPDFGTTPIKPGGLEGWYDPLTGDVLPDDHDEYWQYDFVFDESQWFIQEEGAIYWLCVSAELDPSSVGHEWGWTSSSVHFNDDAVYLVPTAAGSCVVPDNGSGTATTPSDCPFTSVDPMLIIDGLPPGTTIECRPTLRAVGAIEAPGGSLGGTASQWEAELALELTGTGTLSGFSRTLSIASSSSLSSNGPRSPGASPQDFATDLEQLALQLPPGDPDFDLLRVTGGTLFGMPSPGHTTLTRLSSGDWNVDSFFDITYRIDFVGSPGSVLGGMSGSTTGTIRLQQGSAPSSSGEPCVAPDNGGTTASPAECPFTGTDPMTIIDGLPPGTTIECLPTLEVSGVTEAPGGSLGGTASQWNGALTLVLTGTGDMAGYSRTLLFPPNPCTSDNGPRTPGETVQTFPTEMMQLLAQLPPGDPDFDLLRVTCGSGLGMPSPGHTTLTLLPGGDWSVDSFFDITYRIDFVGAPGGPLGGMSGSTTGTIRIQQGDSPGTQWVELYEPPEFITSMDLAFIITNGTGPATGACCDADGNCFVTTNADCVAGGGTYMGDGAVCLGDNDGDGIDDACGSLLVGACCGPDGNCFIASRQDCLSQGGSYLGDGSVCLGDSDGDGVDDVCGASVVRGACCLPDGGCAVLLQAECANRGGLYLGDGTVCLGDNDGNGQDDACETPPKRGACCLSDGTCLVLTQDRCVTSGGTYLGDGAPCLGDLDGNNVDDACEKPDPDFKWEQLPDTEPTGMDVYASVDPTRPPYVLADDFLCTVTGPITRVHVYGSWYLDRLPFGDPRQVKFTISIHSDIPVGPGQDYSKPGDIICLVEDVPFKVKPYAVELREGFMLPPTQWSAWPNGDKVCWEYIFRLPPDLCIQEGTPSNPVVYWLDIQATPAEQGTYFGWKTTLDHWNDDATWAIGTDAIGAILPWQELIYPADHPLGGESIDLAFKIIGHNGIPGTGACCWPDGSCSITTQADCENGATGLIGTYQGDGSLCLGDNDGDGVDDLCGQIEPSGACCYEGPAGPGCINTTQVECLRTYSGTWYPGQDCATFQCPTQPPRGACCYPDAAGIMHCTVTTHKECVKLYGGTWYLGQSCANIDCPTLQPMGVCCYGDPAAPSCVNTTQDLCKSQFNGTWYAGQDCATFQCPTEPELGACCFEDPVIGTGCANTTKADCAQIYGGTWYLGQDCATFDCPTPVPLGACCYGDPASPSCVDATQADCHAKYGGTWYAGQTCATFQCPTPPETGMCCFRTATGAFVCANTSQIQCVAGYGGTWYAGQDCATSNCPVPVPTGVCCFGSPPQCVTTTQDQCVASYGGAWFAGQTCATFQCPATTCCVERVGDANGSGDDEPTIGDISAMIDALFISGNPGVIACLAEADVNQSGGSSPAISDITIGDISILIDYLFIHGAYDPVNNPTGVRLLDCL